MPTPWLRARRYIIGAIFVAGAAFFVWAIPSDGTVGHFADWTIGFFLVWAALFAIAGIYAAAKPTRAEKEEAGQLEAIEGSHSPDRAQLSK
ncbi:hypothetical protein AB0Y14_01045 [Rothia sp. HC945]|uniref:hypothetical protein n=1 Tax=Rothia sp. HC945 TaxID=3171170 RepID=UPI002651ADDD|nr:hypothetical protein [Kocuria sp.]